MTTATTTLTDFLLARIAEDEAWAKAARGWQTGSRHEGQPLDWSIHMDRWAPDRVLAECEAKRRIVERVRFGDDTVADYDERLTEKADWLAADILHDLALPYADHPEFQEAWRA